MRHPGKTTSSWRKLLFRVAAIGLGLSPFLAAEVIVRLIDLDPPSEVEDPFIGFDSVRPLFVRDASGSRYETAENRLEFFQKESFAAEKPGNEFRAFSLGGSTVWGRPFAKETAFSRWLELSLEAADASRQWRFVNCGGVSYASYRLAEVLQEVLQYDPDLIILYTGHNEFLEDRTYEHVKQTSPSVSLGHAMMSRSHAYVLCRRMWISARQGRRRKAVEDRERSVLPTDVVATLDFWGGLDEYHRDDERRQGVIDHFRFNIQRMIRMCQDAKTPVILVNPVGNIRDVAPFKFEPNPDLSQQQQTQVDELWIEASECDTADPNRAVQCLTKALEIDEMHAGIHFHLATVYLMMRRNEEARSHFVKAKDLDICPLRILEPMRDAIRQVCQATMTPMIDLRPVFESESQYGIVGDDLMADHVHPRISTHKRIAELLVDEMRRLGHVATSPGWEDRRDARYARHFAALPATYFPRSQQRLDALRRWTQGRSSARRGRIGSSNSRIPAPEPAAP